MPYSAFGASSAQCFLALLIFNFLIRKYLNNKVICFSLVTPLYKTLHLNISCLSYKNDDLCFGYIDMLFPLFTVNQTQIQKSRPCQHKNVDKDLT